MSSTSTLTEPADSELLQRFVRERDENAFRSLVARHQPMVTGAALRRTGDRELSRDVAQRVFVTLARKADRLVSHARLGGWLYKASSFEASRALQSEQRRRRRERIAADEPGRDAGVESANWEALEDALAAMPKAGRELVVMHYFEDQSYAEMAAQLDLNEAATRKRMSRALADLGGRLSRRGIKTVPSKLLIGAVAVQAALPAEQGLAAVAITTAANSTLLPAIMTSTTAKSCAAVLAIAAIPLTLHWSENKALAEQLENAKLPARIAAGEPGGEDPDLIALRERVAAAGARAGQFDLALAEESQRKSKLEGMLETLGTEFVVSVGDVDSMASECGDLILELAEIERLNAENGGEISEELGEVAMKMMQMLPTAVAVASLDERPDLNARFYAGVLGRALDLDDSGRAQIAAALLPEMQRTKEDGLLISSRPPTEPGQEPGETDWDKRYVATAAAYARAVAPLVPATVLESETWKGFKEGEFAIMLIMVGAEDLRSEGAPLMRAAPLPTPPTDSHSAE